MKNQKKKDIGELYDSGLYDEIERYGKAETVMPVENEYFQPGLVCKVISITHDGNFENMTSREIECRLEKVGRVSKRSTRDGFIKVQKLRFIKQD